MVEMGNRSVVFVCFFSVLALSAFLLTPGWLAAAPAGEQESLTLEQCIELARDRNLSLIKAGLQKKTAASMASAARKDMFPKLSTRYSYRGLRDQETVTLGGRTFPVTSRDNFAWDVTLTQPVFQGGYLWNRFRAAELDTDLAEKRVRQVVNELVRNVKTAYFRVLEKDEIKREAAAAVDRLDAHLRDAQGFYDVGLIPRHGLLQSKVELAQAKQDRIYADHEAKLARSRLNLLLRQDLGAPLILETRMDFVPYHPDLKELQETAIEHRPEIQAARLHIEKARREVRAAKAAYWPRFDLTASYMKNGTDFGLTENPYGDLENAQVMLSAYWEFWAWGQTKDRVAAASYRLSDAETALQEIMDQVAFEVKEAWLRLRDAEAYVEVAELSLAHARENYRLNTERYRQQVATTTDVTDAQALLTKARTRYFNAISGHMTAKARLDYAVGRGVSASDP